MRRSPSNWGSVVFRLVAGASAGRQRGQTMTHGYKRNGTIMLFAALNVLSGQVIGQCLSHHTHVERLKFLKKVIRANSRLSSEHNATLH